MKRKFCIFCGENPVDKNKEHIVPQWLIKMTGKPNRKTIIGTDSKGEKLNIPWSKFVFPSCETCNTEFGIVENKVKIIVTKLLNEEPVSHNQMDLFLDWLDKIRTGLWLGQLVHKKIDLDPHFYINRRVGEKDRICLMYKFDDNENGIGMTGTEFPIFHLIPSCFSFTINNFCFFSYSKEYIISQSFGFPFPSKFMFYDDGRMGVEEFNNGSAKVADLMLEGTILKPTIRFYQTITTGEHQLKKPKIGHKAKFYKENCHLFSKDKIKSRIYVVNGYVGKIGFWEKNEKHEFSGQQEVNRNLLESFVAKMVLEHQVMSARHNMEHYPKETKEGFEELIKTNQYILEKIDEPLKKLVPHYYKEK